MNHQEAKDILTGLLPEDKPSLIKVEVFRLSWEGKGYNIIADETGYDHDYVRKAGSQLWSELSAQTGSDITKRNFRPLLEEKLRSNLNQKKSSLEYPGGGVTFSSPFYIERTDEEAKAYEEISRPGSVTRIKGPRKMGKGSLMLRIIDQADSEGYHVVKIDLKQADSAILGDLDRLLRWLCLHICQQLGLEEKLDDYWNELIGSKLSCSNFVRQYVLEELQQPLVLVINELNLVFDHEAVSRDFLPLLRSWHEESKHNPGMQKLRQVLIYSTEVYVQLDLNLSPFNVGLPIELKPFSGDQLTRLAAVYGFNWRADGMANSPITLLLKAIGGHPYLSQLALYHLASSETFIESPSAALKTLLAHATDAGGIYSDFMQQLLQDFGSNETAVGGFRKLHGNPQQELSRVELYQLERLGLLSIEEGKPVTGNHLLSDYLQANL